MWQSPLQRQSSNSGRYVHYNLFFARRLRRRAKKRIFVTIAIADSRLKTCSVLKMKNSIKISLIFVGLLLQFFLGNFIVKEFVFGDSKATFLEIILYQLVVLPPFLLAVILLLESKNFGRTVFYSILFYGFAATIIHLFHRVPNSVEYPSGNISLGSHGFYVTGGGVDAFSIIPHFVLTLVILWLLKNSSKNAD